AGVWERGEIVTAVRCHPFPKRPDEILVAPSADAELRMRRNVGRIERPERGNQRPSAGEKRPLVLSIGMAVCASRRREEHGTALQHLRLRHRRGSQAEERGERRCRECERSARASYRRRDRYFVQLTYDPH